MLDDIKPRLTSLGNNDALSFIRMYNKIKVPSAQTNELARLIMTDYFAEERMAKHSLNSKLEMLLGVLSAQGASHNWMKSEYLQSLKESLKSLNTSGLSFLVRKVTEEDHLSWTVY